MISIITPTYNRKDMLLDVIKCIEEQSYSNYELIIVDDCSTDGTYEMMSNLPINFKIRYFRNKENMGPGYNRNFGFKQAKGEYVIFMDDDDYYIDSDFFSKAMNCFTKNSNKNIAFVSANAYIESVENSERKKTYIGCEGLINGVDFLVNIDSKYNKPMSTFTTVFNVKALNKADLSNMKMVNDYAIYLRVLLYGNAFIMKDHIGVYRKHRDNISSHIKKSFLIENLEERIWVKNNLIEKANSKKVNEWWNDQMINLLCYYLVGTRPSFSDGFSIFMWIIKNSGMNPKLWIRMNIAILKINIKIILKKYKFI